MPREPFDNATPYHPTPAEIKSKLDAECLDAMMCGIRQFLLQSSTLEIDPHALSVAAMDGIKRRGLRVARVGD